MANGRITDPSNRDEFKIYIRSLLGEPIIKIDVTEFQVDQAVDETIKYFNDYHYLGTTHAYYAYELTQQDIDNRYFVLPKDMIEAVTIYDASTSSGMGLNASLYSGSWQMNYDLIFDQSTGSTGSFLNFYMNKSYYEMINQLLVGMKSIHFNRHQGIVRIDNSWVNYKVGSRIIVDGWQVLDPDEFPDMWSDRWLIRYAAAKLKRQWGENLAKFDATLPGGVKVNYDRIISESAEELRNIEENMLRDYSESPRDFTG